MTDKSKDTERKRPPGDVIVSSLNAVRFAITEPVVVWAGRLTRERAYRNRHENPLVSVCVPTFNRGPILIERAVATVLAQTYTNFELIIVGDHCTDNTEELMAKVKDPRVRFYNLPSRVRHYPQVVENHWFVGPVVPANKAMELARGKWIARVDDDDTWTPDHLEALLDFAYAGNYEFVSAKFEEERFGKRVVIDPVRAMDPYYTRKPIQGTDTSPKIGGVQTWMYRWYLRSMKYNINCYRKSWNRVNDIDLSLRLYHAGVRMGFLDKVVAFVLPRPGEVTVGLAAYKQTEQQKLEQYKFD